MDFTIYRPQWRRGGVRQGNHSSEDTLLLNCQGMMCCLGQISLQCGLTRSAIDQTAEPSAAFGADIKLMNFLVRSDADDILLCTDLAHHAMRINDNERIEDGEREAELRFLFEAEGHTLTFSDEQYPEGVPA